MKEPNNKAARFLRHLEPLQGALEAYCRRSLYDSQSASDVLQSAFFESYRDFDRYAEGTNFRAWIFRYVHLHIQNANRKQRRDRHDELPPNVSIEEAWSMALDEPLLAALLEEPTSLLEHCDEALTAALMSLPSQERDVMLLHAIGEFKYREIAEILQIPLGTVMSGLSRCRQRLRQRLVDYAVESGFIKRQEG